MFKYLRDKKLKSAISNNSKVHTFMHFDTIQSVLILFENQHLEEVEAIVKDLTKLGKTVYLWTHNPDKKAVNPQRQSLDMQTITGRDVSLWGKINPELMTIFDKQRYDAVIDLTQEQEYPLQYLLASCKAPFNVGIKDCKKRLYDFVLLKNQDMSIYDAFIQIKFYLNNMCKGVNN